VLVAFEFGTSNQFPTNPVANEFVCICKRQPMWSADQVKMRFVPCTLQSRLVGNRETLLATDNEPFTARLLDQYKFGPRGGRINWANAPVKLVAENNGKMSPAASGIVPRFVTCNVPPQFIVLMPIMESLSVSSPVLVSLMNVMLPGRNVSVLLMVSVPMEFVSGPGAMRPPDWLVTAPPITPVPDNVPPATVIEPLMPPSRFKMPAFTVVAPP